MVIYFSSSLYSNPPIYPSGNLNMKVYLSVYPTSSLFYIVGTLEGSIVGSYTHINPYIVTSSLNTWQSCTIPISSMVVPNTPIDSIAIISYNSPDTGSQLFFDDISVDFSTIFTPSSSYNDFNPVLNNAVTSRNSTLYRDVDYSYDYKTPVNIQAIVSGSASYAQVPDSNYTTQRIINPRYKGSKTTSLKYNKFTSSGSVSPNTSPSYGLSRANAGQTFLNGDTGSWEGDKAYGKNTSIDYRPTYFSHFNTSFENYNIWGTYVYEIDQLILIPDEDIRGTRNYEPIITPLGNNKENIIDVSSVFKAKDQVNIVYNSPVYGGIDYSLLSIGSKEIIQGAVKFQNIITNESDQTNTSLTCSYDRFKDVFEVKTSTGVPQLGTGSDCLILSGSFAASSYFLPFFNEGRGMEFGVGLCSLYGPQLAVTHNYNQYLYNRQTNTESAVLPQQRLWVDVNLDPFVQDNYISFNTDRSITPNYEFPNTPFLILPGDEIRVTYSASGDNGVSNYVQDFKVLGYNQSTDISQSTAFTQWPHQSGSFNNHYTVRTNGASKLPYTSYLNPSYETIKVYPEPRNLIPPIPKGEIYHFTIRRRIETSNKVIIKSNPPSGSQGYQTKSGGGFLIPDDLSQTQKENVLFIINQLNSKNAFRNNDTIN